MSGIRLIVGAIGVSVLIPTAMAQQPNCTERSNLIRYLDATYAEKPIAIGLADNGSVIELLKSKIGKSWTIIMTTPDGTACRIAAGENWETLSPDFISSIH